MRPASRSSLLSVVLVCAPCSGAVAQDPPLSRGCASVSLRPNLDGGRMLPSQPDPGKRTVTLTFGGTGYDLVLSADVTLAGTERLGGWFPDGRVPKEMRVPFHVVQPAIASGPLVAELTLPATMATIQSVTVHSILYRSGRVWKGTEEDSCTAPISAALLSGIRLQPSGMLSGRWPQSPTSPGGRR
jgi:hypothetical protein